MLLVRGAGRRWGGAAAVAPFFGVMGLVAPVAGPGLVKLFLAFLKIGSVLFGSGYVLLAFLRSEFVGPGMLSEQQLIDAVAVGQFTPGPVFTTATFVGYLLEGVPGALVATVGIFLPAFVFVALTGSLIPRLRASPVAANILDGINVVSLALMAGVTWQLGRAAVVDPLTALLALAALALLLLWSRVSSVWLVVSGALVGLAASMI